MKSMVQGEPIGLLRGPSRGGPGMDVVTPALDDPPARGDFAVVPFDDGALVLRIAGAFPTGSFSETSDRGADYLSQLARQKTGVGVPERIRQLLLRFRLEVVPLGQVRGTPGAWRFEAGVRAIQLFGRPAFRPSTQMLEFLVNVGLDEGEAHVVRLGVLARGHERVPEVAVRFSVRRLKGRRSFVFARAGYGKSNLVKLLLSRLYSAPPDVGLLIVDPEGEYAFAQRSETGRRIPGLLDHPDLRERALVFTERSKHQFTDEAAHRIGGRIKLDFRAMRASEFVSAFVPPDKLGQIWTSWLLSASTDAWSKLVDCVHERSWHSTDEELARILKVSPAGKKGDGDVSLRAIRNNLIPVLQRLHDPSFDLLSSVRARLLGEDGAPPGVVVLDVSPVPSRDADAVVRIVLQRLFQSRVEAFTQGATGQARGILLVLEEAQAVLGGRSLDDQDIYVRWVKEGRKYGLGTLMITQQPGSVSPHIVSQGDNFFAMHLLAERDLQILGQSNAHFTREILDFIRDEPVKGNCYFWSAPDQPYVVPVRVDLYEKQVDEVETVPAAVPALDYEGQLREALIRALATDPRVWLYRTDRPGQLVVSMQYLARNLPAAEALREQRPADWRDDGGFTALRPAPLEERLRALELFQGRGNAVLAGMERPVLCLDESALRARAADLRIEVKALREAVSWTRA